MVPNLEIIILLSHIYSVQMYHSYGIIVMLAQNTRNHKNGLIIHVISII